MVSIQDLQKAYMKDAKLVDKKGRPDYLNKNITHIQYFKKIVP